MSYTLQHAPKLSSLCLVFLTFSAQLLSQQDGGNHDSVRSTLVAPGVSHTSYAKPGPYVLDVLELDLGAPQYKVESYRLNKLIRTTEQVRWNQNGFKHVLGAINADFFSFKTQWPVGNQVVNGKFVLGNSSARSHIAFDKEGKPSIERLAFRGWVRTSRGKLYPISGVNDVHRTNSIVLHTSYSDSNTSFGGAGVTFGLRLLSAHWIAGDTLKMVVKQQGVHDTATIAPNDAVLWIGPGIDVWRATEEVCLNDTLTVYLGFDPDLRHITQVVGGRGRILKNGQPFADSSVVLEEFGPAFARDRHPRTFVGFNRDTTKLFLCTVDGRQAASVGMNFKEMAEFLQSIGVWNAINLDGGGSTTMVVNGAIVNSPSDKTGERPVANTLQIIDNSVVPNK